MDFALTLLSWMAAIATSRKAILGLVLIVGLLVAFAVFSADAFAGSWGRR
jgi:hypothetical protein